MRQSKIQYNPALTVKENAKRNGVSEAAVRYYIKVNLLDRRFDRKQNIIDDCRKYLRKHPKATKAEFTTKLGHSQSTIRKYWEYITTEKELTLFDKKKQQKRLLRQANNFYATHPSVTQDILREESFNKRILEPFCGSGTMSKVIEENGYEVKAYDIIDRGYGEIADFFNTDFSKGEFDIISNPPYDDKLCEVVARCLSICKNKVALLFPLRYLSGKARYEGIFKIFPPKLVYVYMERIGIAKNADFEKYNNSGSNLEIYAWYIWEKGYKGKTELRWIKNETKSKVKAIDKGSKYVCEDIPHLFPNALLGCACGDIIGSRFEFHNIKETDFELFTFRSRYTDDTCLTVCMCEWLLYDPAHKKETLAEKLVYYSKHFKQKCYGHKFKEWVNNPNRQIGQVSSSNGCAMRVSPIGWYAKSIEEAEELAEISASITHNHPDAIKGAKAIVDAIVLIREGNTKEEVKDFISGVFGYNLETSCDELRKNTEWTSECSVCVPNAIRAFLESWDFESAIRLAVSLGGDSDTIAAMTGSIAEAYYGIPDDIRDLVAGKLERNPKFVEVINEFTRQYMPLKPE